MSVAVLLRVPDEINAVTPPLILLLRPVTSIGRRADVVLDTPVGHEISKIHATIYHRNRDQTDIWVLEDNRSTNGTFVNRMKIHRKVLSPGDEVVFGGGPNFQCGDFLQSTSNATCRYLFLLPSPTVKFANGLDPNDSQITLSANETCPICYQAIANTRILPCGHRFCDVCIESWADECRLTSRAPTCPLCRRTFPTSHLRHSDAVLSDGVLEVWSFEALLRDLNVANCKMIRGAHIFKQWTPRHKKWFWKALAIVEGVPTHKILFLHLTKATLSHVLAASDPELAQGLRNFGVEDPGDDQQENRRKLIMCIVGVIGKAD
jgi:hypothetical protein